MRIVYSMEDLEREFEGSKNESKKAFGDDKLFIEKYLRGPKHIEVQVLGDHYGNVVHLYDRNCSVQRRHQKVVEYAPAFSLPDKTREIIFESAIRLSRSVGYRNAGTLEFLVDEVENAKTNQIFLDGYICKAPVYRKTPLGREIADLLIAVNRPYGKSDYIPCICWGRNARFASGFEVGGHAQIWGRIQSREYVKKIDETESEKRIAYEVSVSKLEYEE